MRGVLFLSQPGGTGLSSQRGAIPNSKIHEHGYSAENCVESVPSYLAPREVPTEEVGRCPP